MSDTGSKPSASPAHGRVIHDQRGNAVWDWAIETGVLARTTVADLIRTLAPMPLALEIENEPGGWSGDPYNRPLR